MKAITVYEPYASLIAIGAKKTETRGWATQYRGPLAIHAGLDRDKKGERIRHIAAKAAQYGIYIPELQFGKVIAIADLVDCVPTEGFIFSGTLRNISEEELAFGDYTPGRYAWLLDNVRRIDPVPARGQQRLWNLDQAGGAK